MEQVRLQKYFTDCGIMSRRAAEREIESGNVTINGNIASLGTKVTPGIDKVFWKQTEIVPQSNKEFIYIMLNKPCGYISAVSDKYGKRCVSELVCDTADRVYPVGRLDMNSEGLLLFTNDGEFAQKMMHPRHEIPKIYHVTVNGNISDKQLEILRSALIIDGYKILPVESEIIDESSSSTTLCMKLYEGRNRQIRRMCAAAGLKVKKLIRIAIGELSMENLPQGKWRTLTKEEISYLYGKNQ